MNNMITIPIPAPPNGWVFDGIRRARHDDCYFNDGTWRYRLDEGETVGAYLVAVRVKPNWTPPPEWAALFGHCWLTRDVEPQVALHKEQPIFRVPFWSSPNSIICTSSFILPNMLPPKDIPADQCCWEIGG